MSHAANRLEMTVCGIRFRNPVLAASGTFGYGIEFEKNWSTSTGLVGLSSRVFRASRSTEFRPPGFGKRVREW